MQEIVEYERRISQALRRIEAGFEAIGAARALDLQKLETAEERIGQAEAARAGAEAAKEAQIARAAGASEMAERAARQAADEIRAAKAAARAEVEAMAASVAPSPGAVREEPTLVKLREKLSEAREREAVLRAGHVQEIQGLKDQLDAQGLELLRLQRSADTLRDELRRLHEAATAGLVDAAGINRAMLAELEALRAMRLAERAELEEIAAALAGQIGEAENA